MKFNMAEELKVTSEQFVKRLVYLAWKASKVVGLGTFQDRGNQPEDIVWIAAYGKCDYPRENEILGFENKPGDVYCDYVFGRMMKLGVTWNKDGFELRDGNWSPDYQSFCLVYQNPEDLVAATIESFLI